MCTGDGWFHRAYMRDGSASRGRCRLSHVSKEAIQKGGNKMLRRSLTASMATVIATAIAVPVVAVAQGGHPATKSNTTCRTVVGKYGKKHRVCTPTNGKSGSSGIAGSQGQQGPQGIPGTPGTPGTPGAPGVFACAWGAGLDFLLHPATASATSRTTDRRLMDVPP